MIEIVGCNGKNIGDILMLEALIQELHLRQPKAAFAVRRRSILERVKKEAHLAYLPLARPGLRRQGFKEKANDLLLAPLSALAGVFPGLTSAYGVTGIVDVCGYKYGGLWGRGAIDADLREYQREKRRGRKIVLLPKTFGPFSDASTEAAVCDLIKLCDLCFCRDQLSHEHLVTAGVPPERCPVFPDFTTTVRGMVDPKYKVFTGRPVLIPNFRMVDSGRDMSEIDYGSLLERLVDLLRERQLDPFLLVHDSGRDLAFCQKLAAKQALEVVQEQRAVVVKGLIGQAGLVYSDRLHGMINALSQGVPVLTSGWSFKYAEALKTYDTEHLQILPEQRTRPGLEACIDRLLAEGEALRKQLLQAATRLKQRNGLMWDQISRCLF